MSTHEQVMDLIAIVLRAVAEEAGKQQDQLTVEVESVVTRGLMEAFKRGGTYVHERPTEAPPSIGRRTPADPMPAVRPRTPLDGTPRPRFPTPMPRKRRSDQ